MKTLHTACILLGSNIAPVRYMPLAMQALSEDLAVLRISQTWETQAVGSNGPNFLNTAVLVQTLLPAVELKQNILAPIENKLGRVRSADKNAPRTIDLDLLIYDDQILDVHLWDRLFIALPVSEVLPNLPHPTTGQPLRQIAQELFANGWALCRTGIIKQEF
jgi:2-amino-4-hydroxy-6-hydroxymethyldihydropteridine diphosphokinase